MRNTGPLLITLILFFSCTAAVSQETNAFGVANEAVLTTYLHNNDVLRMVEKGQKSGDIIATIFTSPCNFDVFPPVLRDLKRRGVPDTVLVAMKMAPNGPPALRSTSPTNSITTPVRIPSGLRVDVEAAYPISSEKAKKGDLLTFQVTRPVFINDVLIIDRGAVAKARVVAVKPARTFGRGGMLAWAMNYVVAVDGTQLPLEVSGRIRGNNRSAIAAGGAVATASLIFPYTSPVALVWGLKKGDEAILRGSKPFPAVTSEAREVAGLPLKKDKLIFHSLETLKASSAPSAPAQFERLPIRH